MIRKLATVAVLACAIAGCSTSIALTDKGKGVSHTTDADKPGGCRLIGDVVIGVPPDAARPPTEADLITLMRNKAGEMGGTHVVVDSKEQRNPESEDASYWTGRGRSYSCPESESAPPEEDIGLPEEEEEASEEEAEGDLEQEPAEEEPARERRDTGGVSDDELLDAI